MRFDPRQVVFACVSAVLMGAAFGATETISLNGKWHYLGAETAKPVPPIGEWREVDVPGQQGSSNTVHFGFFRRKFDVPESLRGGNLCLRFTAVKFTATVFLNGKEVGQHLGGYEPFEIAIGEAARPQANEIVLRAGDWSTLLKEPVDFSKPLKPGARVTDRAKRSLMAPVGSHSTRIGPWEGVELIARPQVYVEDVFVTTSTRRHSITAQITVHNLQLKPALARLSADVLDGESRAIGMPDGTITVPAGGSAAAKLTRQWDNAKLWAPDHPHLYHLRVAMDSAGVRDEATVRFGFREFWCDGPHFLLNGIRTKLLATSTHPSAFTREAALETYEIIKRANCKAMRLHAQPWSSHWYDVADEVGMLIIHESALWCLSNNYAFDDPKFWANCAQHIQGQIKLHRNHPSIIMWSMENELLHCGGSWAENAEPNIAGLGRAAKEVDPTRPVQYDADGDPMGEADAINLHYPYDYPRVKAYPNVAYWLQQPTKIYGWPRKVWSWDRKKPLYFGEFLWVPSSKPTWHTVWFGDDAYLGYRKYRNLGKAKAWRMQIEAFRYLGVSGMCPWNIFEGGPWDDNPMCDASTAAYRPIAAFVKEYDTRFFEGEEVTREVTIYNDTYAQADLTFNWTVGKGNRPTAESVRLEPAGIARRTIRFRSPAQGPFELALKLAEGKQERFRDVKRYQSYARLVLPSQPIPRLGLYDPSGKTRKLLDREGLSCAEVASLGSVPSGLRVLLIAANVLKEGESTVPVVGRDRGEAGALRTFVRAGGRVIVLEQGTYPPGLLPVALNESESTMAFVRDKRHPIVRGLADDAFKFWRGDHVVVRGEIARPLACNYRVVVDCGSAQGLASSGLLELYEGDGLYLLSQLAIAQKFEAEPMARVLLARLLARAQTYEAHFRPAAVATDRGAFGQLLASLGVCADDVTGRLGEVNLGHYGTVLLCGGIDEVVSAGTALKRYLNAGGQVLLHDYDRKSFSRISAALGIDAELMPGCGVPVRALRTDALTLGLANEDLYWYGEHRGRGYSETPLAANIARYVFGPSIDLKHAKAIDAKTMRVRSSAHSRPERDGFYLGCNGDLITRITFDETGTYCFGITARGTPVEGVYPLIVVRIDGQRLGTVYAAGEKMETYTVSGVVQAGDHELCLSFTNDRQVIERKEDRNVVIQSLSYLRLRPEDQDLALTTPSAMARIPVGQGVIIVNQVRWESAERNMTQAACAALNLLTNLGVRASGALGGTALEAEAMTPQPDLAHCYNRGSCMYMGSTGYIEGPVEFAASGRYTFALVARGTKAAGVYPNVALLIDGKSIGAVDLKSTAWHRLSLEADVTGGRHTLRIHFTNDYYDPPEDRNLEVDKVVIGRIGRR